MRAFGLTLLCLLATRAWTASTGPALVWKMQLPGRIYTSPLACELRPEPGLEIVVCSSESREIYCLSAAGKVLWKYGEGFTARLASTPSAGDLDGDGALELVVAGGGGNLVCLEAEGTLKWRRALTGEVEWSAPVVADLQGDGTPEVIVGTQGAHLYCLAGANGSVLWEREPGWIGGLLAAADLDGDGRREILLPLGRALQCLDDRGEKRWEFTQPVACNAASVGDLDGDGKPEIVAAFDDRRVACLDAAGKCRWLALGGYSGGGEGTLSGPTLWREGNDGRVVVADGGGGVRCLDAQGRELWYLNVRGPAGEAPVAGDVDGDGAVEVLLGLDDDGTVVCIGPGPQVDWRFSADFRVVSSPTLVDVEGDGRTEVLVSSNDNCLYCLRPRQRPGGVLPWPARRADAGQTGVLP